MEHHYWHYFISIENEIINVSKYIEIHKTNFKTFSVELTRLLLSICSEVDVLIKLLCQKIDPVAWKNAIESVSKTKNRPDPDMDVYRPFICQKLPTFNDVKIKLSQYDYGFVPWKNFHKDMNPEWWFKYNLVKHQRDKHYKEAKLGNVLNSAAGLLVVLIYLYGYKKQFPLPESIRPKLFLIPDDHLSNNAQWAPPSIIIPNL